MILTHIDDDHIGGFLKWLTCPDNRPKIQRIFFNTGRKIRAKLGLPMKATCPEDCVKVTPDGERYGTATAIGILQAMEDCNLSSALQDVTASDLPETALKQGATLRFISPSVSALRTFAEKWEEDVCKKGLADMGTYGAAPSVNPSFRELSEEPYVPDRSITNGASLAFLFERRETRLAFLGDAWAEECVAGLEKAGWSEENPCQAALVKLSHHGSPHNLSPKLARTLLSSHFLISSKETAAVRAQKITIARLLKLGSPLTIIRNYRYEDNFLTDDDRDCYIDTGQLRLVCTGWGGEQSVELEKEGVIIRGKTDKLRPYRPRL